MAHLAVRDLHLSFGGLKALDGVNLEIEKGEIFGLVGPNGAGKTCVLNVINGLYRAQRGSVLLNGRDITRLPPHKVAQLGIARTFQGVELFKHMTVLENLLLGRHILMRTGVLTGGILWGPALKEEVEHRRRVEEVIDFLELERYRKALVVNLPYGIQKLVGVARALAMEPQVMLLDEPSSGMSRQEKEDLARFLLRIKHELGITMLWVEHDMQLVGDLCDRMAVLHYGRKIAEGRPEEVTRNPEVIHAYLGEAEPVG